MKNLQAAVDDCYAAQLAEAQKALSDSIPPTGSAKTRFEKQQADALTALGDPKDGGASAIATQKADAAADAKDKANKGKSAKNILKDKIAKLLKDLQDCEANCPPPKEPETPAPKETGPDDGKQPVNEKPPPAVPTAITLPAAPECFDTEADRQAFIEKWEKVCAEQNSLARLARKEVLALNKNDPWYAYWTESEKIYQRSHDDLRKIIDDAADEKKTPLCPKKGGGGIPKKPGDKPKKAPRVQTGHNISYDPGAIDDFCHEIADHKITFDTVGTGETIGHVADAIVENLTDQPLSVAIPPIILESRTGKNQHYAVPNGSDTVDVPPHEKKRIPLNGVCLARNKPPVDKDAPGDLAIPNCDPDSKIGGHNADTMLRIARSKYDAADQLEKDGLLKDIPYHDPQKRKDIVVQWSTWSDPRISDITGAPPATKDDLKKVVYKQAEAHGPVTPDTKKKLDDGIDKIFDKIELTTEKAKDLEKTEEPGEGETPPSMPPGTVNVSNDTPTPAPQTTEKPKKEKPKETPNESPAKGEKPPMTKTRLLVNVLKGVDSHDANDVTRPTKDDIKKELSKAVKDANKLLSKCGVELDLAGADVVFDAPNPDTPGSESMGGNYDGDKAKDIDKKAGEELKKAHGKPTTGFKVYVVTEITNKEGSEQGVGYWFPEEGSDATHPGFCILEASTLKDGRLLAHELGHGLGGLSDGDTKGNLMNPKPGVSDANDLSDDQCKKLQNGVKQRQ